MMKIQSLSSLAIAVFVLLFPVTSRAWIGSIPSSSSTSISISISSRLSRTARRRTSKTSSPTRLHVSNQGLDVSINLSSLVNRTDDKVDVKASSTNGSSNGRFWFFSPQESTAAAAATTTAITAASVNNNNNNNHNNIMSSLPTLKKKKSTRAKPTTTTLKNGSSDDNDSSIARVVINKESLIAAVAVLAVAVGVFSYAQSDAGSSLFPPLSLPPIYGGSNLLETTRGILSDPGAALDKVVESVNWMGPLGIVYFGIAYMVAEILAIPAVRLTASAGYLFGPVQGTAIVLFSASVAAAVSFAIGRTLLREYVEGVLQDYPKFAKLDKAICREGFKLMLLLRLSPIFPFALSNYLYGASSINFSAFFGGTLLGFTPGTIVYVYTGYVGKALTDGGGDVYPWYVYLGGLTIFGGLLKVLADTATRIVEEIEEEEDDESYL